MPWAADDERAGLHDRHAVAAVRPGRPGEGRASPVPPVLSAYRQLLALRRELLPGLGRAVTELPAPEGLLALAREGGLVVVLNSSGEDVEVKVDATELLAATADGAALDAGVVTVPAASTVWLRG